MLGIPKLFVRDLIASENTPVFVVSKTKSGGVSALTISPNFEQTKNFNDFYDIIKKIYTELIFYDIKTVYIGFNLTHYLIR